MRLPMLPEVVFDDFPTDGSVKYCIFTQPKFPEKDYSMYRKNVMYCGTVSTLFVLAHLKKLSLERFHVLSERRVKLKCSTPFGIRSIQTGSSSGAAMFLIEIGDAIYLYTGQFTRCRQALLNPVLQYYRNRIDDIYVDNTMANLRVPCLLRRACSQIKQILSDHIGYTIYLHMELFGYEDLLYELARDNIKIQLTELQKILFKSCNLDTLFEFDENPQIKVYARFQEEKAFQLHEYKRFFEIKKILHIKLIASQHEIREPEKIQGLILVPYTPHPGAYELHDLFRIVEPKRVHPLVKQSYIDDSMTVISNDLLNESCEVVGYDLLESDQTKETETSLMNSEMGAPDNDHSFLELTPITSGEFSSDISDILLNEESQTQSREPENYEVIEDKDPEDNVQQTSNSSSIRGRNVPHEIISLDEDGDGDEEEEDCLELDEIAHHRNPAEQEQPNKPSDKSNVEKTGTNETNQNDITANQSLIASFMTTEMDASRPNAQATESASKQIKCSSDKQSDANNNGEDSPAMTPTATKQPTGIKRKVLQTVTPPRFLRIRGVEYLSDSDDDECLNEHQKKSKSRKRTENRFNIEVQNKALNNVQKKVSSEQQKQQQDQNNQNEISNELRDERRDNENEMDSDSSSDCYFVFPEAGGAKHLVVNKDVENRENCQNQGIAEINMENDSSLDSSSESGSKYRLVFPEIS